MDNGAVRLVVEFPKDVRFERGRGGQHGERLVAVGGEDDLVEIAGGAVGKRDPCTFDGADGVAFGDAVGEGRGELFHILARSSRNGAPRVLGVEAEEAVVVPKAHERPGGEGLDALRRRGPDGGGHGRKIPAQEIRAVAASLDVFDERHLAVLRVGEFGDGFLVEAVDLEEGFPEAGAEEVFPLGEKQVERAAVELHAIGDVLDGKGHRGRLGLHPELPEQAGEVRVGDLVVNHEAGVQR